MKLALGQRITSSANALRVLAFPLARPLKG